MDAKTLEALKASIAKWDKNSRIRNVDNARTAADDCPLCQLFHEDFKGTSGESCVGCPVWIATGEEFCHGSPYGRASRARFSNKPAEFRSAAKEEATFLRSLLPEPPQ